MSRVCAICNKSTVHGRNISHAHNVTNRTFRPNLKRVRALIEGRVRRVMVCTRCLRSGKITKPPANSYKPEADSESAATP